MKDDTSRSGRAAKGGPPGKQAPKTPRVGERTPRSERSAKGDSSRSEAAKAGSAADDTTHFGYETVPLADKQGRVNDVFHSVARRYDLMNDLMSAGLHRVWKEALVTALRPSRTRPFRHLDVAGGTGDVAFRILDAGGPGTHVTVLDINGAMLSEGRARAGARYARYEGRIDFVEANAEALPFEPKAFDAYTVAFGIRNVPRIEVALREAHRVLKTGGHFLCLEFSKVDVPGFDALYEAYSFNVIPALGQVVAGDAESYRYLVESIRRFPPPAAFARMIEEAGFRRVTHRLLTGGVVAIHSGWKVV
jgi:demethylmenaquinone methyltransferase/2-methoxy-6-polyprenyl-1,4-benzoquinol methylase